MTDETETIKQQHPDFTITCDQCQSTRIEIRNTMDGVNLAEVGVKSHLSASIAITPQQLSKPMTEHIIIHLVPAREFTNHKTSCKRGHPFTEGSYSTRTIFVKSKPYIVRTCLACAAHRQSQHRKRSHRKNNSPETPK